MGNCGTRIAELEVMNDYARDTQLYLNEDWDKMIGVIRTREMSFGDPITAGKIRWLDLLNATLRPVIAQYNYLAVKLIQHFNPNATSQTEIFAMEKSNVDTLYPNKLSLVIPINKQVFTGMIDIVYARTLDSENPKLILTDMVVEILDTQRRRLGGF